MYRVILKIYINEESVINIFLLFLLSFFRAQNIYALEFNSGENKIHLIELYTSQSCSSCPPAEKWISRFKGSRDLWKKYIPIAFHVSYWNHLSWVDTFSKESYSKRQRDYDNIIKAGVYTPQILIDGKDFRKWRTIEDTPQLEVSTSPGNLKVILDDKNKTADFNFISLNTTKELHCYGAYIESGHSTEVISGENKGRKIDQDFIVRNLYEAKATKNGQHYSCRLNMHIKNIETKSEHSLVFWLINNETYEVVQATGGKSI